MFSRSAIFLRLNNSLKSRRYFSNTAVRNHGAAEGTGPYRNCMPPVTYGPRIKAVRTLQVILCSFIMYNFWYDPHMMLGHPQFPMPDPTEWTDEELGIPPDDYDEVVQMPLHSMYSS